VKESKLRPDPKNARRRTDRGRKMIESSLREVGAFRSIAVDADGIIRAGNGVAEAAKKLGMKIRIVKGKSNELIAIQRDDLRGRKAERAALFDNRTGELSVWDPDILAGLSDPMLQGIFEPIELPTAPKKAEKKGLKPYRKLHILLSFDASLVDRMQTVIDKLANVKGIEIEKSAN
jgi:hypothetical protein